MAGRRTCRQERTDVPRKVEAFHSYTPVCARRGAEDWERLEISLEAMNAWHIVHIEAKDAEDYAGAHAYFNGDYYKSGKLQKPIDLTKPE